MARLEKIKQKLLSGHERTVKANKNIFLLFGMKGIAIIINLLLIPLTLNVLGDYKFGVWVILFNLLTWIQILDIGLGNGLRNKFSEALSRKEITKAREYVSTTYVLMGVICIILIICFLGPWFYLNWADVIGADQGMKEELFYVIGITFILASIQFWIKIISNIYLAAHKPAYTALMSASSNLIILCVLFLGSSYFLGSIIRVGILFSSIPLFIFILFSIRAFCGEFKDVKPSIKFFNRKKIPELFTVGIQFFIIQIAVIVIFQTDSLLLSHLIDPSAVTDYNIVFRYFGVITMLFGIIMTPYWSAYTDAYAKNDLSWIKNVLKKQFRFLILTLLAIIPMYYFAPTILRIWISEDFKVDANLNFYMALFAVLAIWNNLFSTLLSGLSFVRLGTFVTIFTALINIPLSIFFLKNLDMGVSGVVLATIICLTITAIISPCQVYYFIFSKKRTIFFDKLLK
jgi:O-antigen/teichoic acid export membrane protein